MKTTSEHNALRSRLSDARELGKECVHDALFNFGYACNAGKYDGDGAVEYAMALAAVVAALDKADEALSRATRIRERRARV